MLSGISPVSSIVSFIPGILYSSIISSNIVSSSSFLVGRLLKTSSPSVPKIFYNFPPNSKVGGPTSGGSYKKSSIYFSAFFSVVFSLGPAIRPIDTNTLFPIGPLPSIFGRTNGFFPEITSKSFRGGSCIKLLLNGMF